MAPNIFFDSPVGGIQVIFIIPPTAANLFHTGRYIAAAVYVELLPGDFMPAFLRNLNAILVKQILGAFLH